MHKLKHLLFLFTLVLSLSSCEKDDEEPITNELVFDGESHPLKSGKLINYSNMDPVYRYGIQLNSSELDEENGIVDPIFNQFYFQIMNHGSPSKVNGIIGSSLMVFNAEPGNNANLEAYHVNEGTAEVLYSNGTYTIRFEGTAVNNLDDEDDREIEFRGNYQGELANSEDFR